MNIQTEYQTITELLTVRETSIYWQFKNPPFMTNSGRQDVFGTSPDINLLLAPPQAAIMTPRELDQLGFLKAFNPYFVEIANRRILQKFPQGLRRTILKNNLGNRTMGVYELGPESKPDLGAPFHPGNGSIAKQEPALYLTFRRDGLHNGLDNFYAAVRERLGLTFSNELAPFGSNFANLQTAVREDLVNLAFAKAVGITSTSGIGRGYDVSRICPSILRELVPDGTIVSMQVRESREGKYYIYTAHTPTQEIVALSQEIVRSPLKEARDKELSVAFTSTGGVYFDFVSRVPGQRKDEATIRHKYRHANLQETTLEDRTSIAQTLGSPSAFLNHSFAERVRTDLAPIRSVLRNLSDQGKISLYELASALI